MGWRRWYRNGPALWRRAGKSTTPFQSPWWQLAWWQRFGSDSLMTAIVRGSDGQLIGLFSAYVLAEAGGHKLLPVGAGSSDYLDALIDPAAPLHTADWLIAAVLESAICAQCDLIDLPPGAALRDAATPRGWRSNLRDSSVCPVLVFAADACCLRRGRAGACTAQAADEQASRGSGRRMDHQLWPRRTTLRAGWHALIICTGRGGTRKASRAVCWGTTGWQRCWLMRCRPCWTLRAAWLVGLTIGGDAGPAAACLAFVGSDRLFLYLSGFDAARAFESPGTLLIGALLEIAAERGIREVDFLRGGEAYKYAWGARDRVNATRMLSRV